MIRIQSLAVAVAAGLLLAASTTQAQTVIVENGNVIGIEDLPVLDQLGETTIYTVEFVCETGVDVYGSAFDLNFTTQEDAFLALEAAYNAINAVDPVPVTVGPEASRQFFIGVATDTATSLIAAVGSENLVGVWDLCDTGCFEGIAALPTGQKYSYAVFTATVGEAVGPSIRVPDIDSDSVDDIATLRRQATDIENLIYLNSGANGSLIRTQSTGSPEPIDITVVPDANGDGIDDLGVLQTEGGNVEVVVLDMTEPDAALDEIARVGFAPANIPQALIAYRGTAGESWVGVLGVSAAGDVRLQLKAADGSSGTRGNIPFAPSFPPEFIDVVPDISGDGISEVAVLGIDASGNIRAQLKNGADGSLIHWIQYAKAFTPLQMIVIPDTDAGPSIGVLQTHPDGRVRIQVKYAATRQPVGTGAVNFAQSFEPQLALAMPDKNGNGFSELAVLGIRNGTDIRAQIKDSVTSQAAGEVFFSKNFPPIDFFYLDDSNGNNVAELVVFGRNPANMNIRGQVKDAETSEELTVYSVP